MVPKQISQDKILLAYDNTAYHVRLSRRVLGFLSLVKPDKS